MKKIEVSQGIKLASIWCVWAFLAVGSIGWALFVVLKYFDAVKDASSWIQAFGSVLAIFAAVWVASNQSRQLQVQQHQKKIVLLRSLLVLSARAFRVCEGLISYDIDSYLSSDNLVRGLNKSFGGINILELPDPRLIDLVCSIGECMQEIQERLVDEQNEAMKAYYAKSQRLTVILATVMVSTNGIGKVFNELNGSVSEDHPEHISLKRPRGTSPSEPTSNND